MTSPFTLAALMNRISSFLFGCPTFLWSFMTAFFSAWLTALPWGASPCLWEAIAISSSSSISLSKASSKSSSSSSSAKTSSAKNTWWHPGVTLSILICSFSPVIISSQNFGVYSCAFFARPCRRGTWKWPLLHLLAILFAIHREFVAKVVGFLFSPSPVTFSPNAHVALY